MGTISFQVAETGQTTLNKTYTMPDTHVDRLVAAYQAGANISVGGTATRAQVLNFWTQTMINGTVQQVFSSENAAIYQAIVQANLITPV